MTHARSRHKSPCFKTLLNQAIVEWNALFKILAPDFFNLLRLSTRQSRALSVWFWRGFGSIVSLAVRYVLWMFLSPRGVTPHLSFCSWIHPQTLLSPVTDIGSVDAVCISLTPASSFPPYLAIDGRDWMIFRFSFDSGAVDVWRKFFSRLPIRTIRNPIVKSDFLLSSITESHWSHWSVLETTDWEKAEWVQCFPLCSVTTH